MPLKNYIFKFENCWFQRPDLDGIVERIWKKNYPGKSALDRFHNKMKNMRKILKGWNLNFEASLRKHKKMLAGDIDRLDKKEEDGALIELEREYKKYAILI